MSIHPLCLDPHPTLRRPAQPIDAFTTQLRRVAADMIETMHAHDGVGLAAPQIGLNIQLFVANASRRRGKELIVTNPVIAMTQGRAAVVEGCLSVPNLWERVARAARVRITGQDVWGKPMACEADGLLAIILQHEIDHLRGRLFIDRLSWIRRCSVALRCVARRLASAQHMSSGTINSAKRNLCA